MTQEHDPGPSPAALEAARTALAGARRIVVLTGAGISAESGIATFRDPGGLWDGFKAEDLASPAAFARDPAFVWGWYDARRVRVAAAKPNPAHRALAALERARPGAFTLVTQNVDGLHQRAGSVEPIELHGSLWLLRCTGCGSERRDLTAPLTPLPPACPRCRAIERPGVVWFGEFLPEEAFLRAEAAVEAADLVLVVGTSNLVHPAAGLVVRAIERDIPTIEVNPEPTRYAEGMTWALAGKAGVVLPSRVTDG